MLASTSEHLRAPLAQLDRVAGFEPVGREFESLRARHFIQAYFPHSETKKIMRHLLHDKVFRLHPTHR